MTSKRTKLQEDTHFRVLRLLQDNPDMSQRAQAEAVGVSVGGIHYVLNARIDKGLVKWGNFTAAEDKRRYAIVLTPKGIVQKAALTRAFWVRKMEEYEAFKKEIDQFVGEIEDNAPISVIEWRFAPMSQPPNNKSAHANPPGRTVKHCG